MASAQCKKPPRREPRGLSYGCRVWRRMACVDGRPAGQARSIACRASCGCVLFGLTAIAAVRLPYLAMAGHGALHPPGLSTDHVSEIFWWWQAAQSRREDRVQSEGGHRPAVAGATERERGAGTPERPFGSGPVRLTGGSLGSPGSGFSSRCRAMGHRSSCRLAAGDPLGRVSDRPDGAGWPWSGRHVMASAVRDGGVLHNVEGHPCPLPRARQNRATAADVHRVSGRRCQPR